MNVRHIARWQSLLVIAGLFLIATGALVAQAPARGGQSSTPATSGIAWTRRGRGGVGDAPATVLQVMRGILFPNSNGCSQPRLATRRR